MFNKKLLILLPILTIIILLSSHQYCFATGQGDNISVPSTTVPTELISQKPETIEQISSLQPSTTLSVIVDEKQSNSIQLGSTGSKIVTVQCKLEMTKDSKGEQYFTMPQGVNYGYYGELTDKAVKKFQTDKGLTPDGEVDSETWKKMELSEGEFILARGSNDSNVTELQQNLQALNFFKGIANGAFDTFTESAVNEYKDQNNLWNFGIYKGKVGKTTWDHILNTMLEGNFEEVSLKVGYYDIADAYIENGVTRANVYDVVHALKGHVEQYGHGTDKIVSVFYPLQGMKTAVIINGDEVEGYSVRKLALAAGYGDKITYTANAGSSPSVFVDVDNTPTDTMGMVLAGVKFVDDCSTALMMSGYPMFIGAGEGVMVVRQGGKLVVKELSTLNEATLLEKAATSTFLHGKAAEKFLARIIGGTPHQSFWTKYGIRIVDQYCEEKKIAYEAKVGYTTLTNFVRKQILKDATLLAQYTDISRVEWHFFRSTITGEIGASKQLLDFLTQNGIKFVIHQ